MILQPTKFFQSNIYRSKFKWGFQWFGYMAIKSKKSNIGKPSSKTMKPKKTQTLCISHQEDADGISSAALIKANCLSYICRSFDAIGLFSN